MRTRALRHVAAGITIGWALWSSGCTWPAPEDTTTTDTSTTTAAADEEIAQVADLSGLGDVTEVSASRDGTLIAAAVAGSPESVAAIVDGEPTTIGDGHTPRVAADGTRVTYQRRTGNDTEIVAWNAATRDTDTAAGAAVHAGAGHAISADGSTVAWVSATNPPTIQVWDIEDDSIDTAGAATPGAALGPIALSGDGAVLTYGVAGDGTHRVQQVTDTTDTTIVDDAGGEVVELASSDDGRRIAYQTRSSDGPDTRHDVGVWSATPFEIEPDFGELNWSNPQLSPDGRHLYMTSSTQWIDVEDREFIWTYDLDGSSTVRHASPGATLVVATERTSLFWQPGRDPLHVSSWTPR